MTAAVVCHAVLIVLELIALIGTARFHGVRLFMYYTQDSNILGLAGSVCYLVTAARRLKSGGEIPRWVRLLRYSSASCLALTFAVVVLLLAPLAPGGYRALLLEGNLLVLHFLGPVISCGSFLLLEDGPKLEPQHIWAAFFPTALYAAAAVSMNAARRWHGPYFFLYVYEQPWWLSLLYLAVICGAALALAWLLKAANGRIHRPERDS